MYLYPITKFSKIISRYLCYELHLKFENCEKLIKHKYLAKHYDLNKVDYISKSTSTGVGNYSSISTFAIIRSFSLRNPDTDS